MELAHILGLKRIVCGYSANEFKDMDSIKATAERTSRMAEILNRNGFELFQHNHAFEFERIDGRLKYEIYAELCPLVKFQIDCFWSTNLGREDAVEMLKKFIDRTVLLHIKDGPLQQKEAEQKYVNGILDRKIELLPLGQGDLPIRELVAMAPNVDAVIVELDYCNVEMFQAIEESYRFLTSNGIAAGNK
jgi:sugar phosphate isomerase/epimerase